MRKKLLALSLAVIMMFTFITPAFAATTPMDELTTAQMSSVETLVLAQFKYFYYRVCMLDMTGYYSADDPTYTQNADGTCEVTITTGYNYSYTATLDIDVDEDGNVSVDISDEELHSSSNIYIALIKYGLNYLKDLIVDAIEGLFTAE